MSRLNEVEINDLGPLTAREGEALLWVAEGKTAWEAGTILGITEATINSHIASAAEKLGASNRPHLVARAFITGVLVPAGKIILLVSVLAGACGGDLDEARAPRPGRRRDDFCVNQTPSTHA